MMSAAVDLVYVVARNGSNDELRYSLRSVAANLPHRHVVVAGYQPRWLTGVAHVPVAQDSDKWTNQARNVRAALAEVDDRFVLFNDDFFVVEPAGEVPVMHGGSLAKTIKGLKRRSHPYALRMIDTLEFLGGDALSFDRIHTPLPMRRDEARRMFADIDGRYLFRSVYGNWFHDGGVETGDVKVRGRTVGVSGVFVSTSDRSWQRSEVGRRVRRLFPDPCVYEADR